MTQHFGTNCKFAPFECTLYASSRNVLNFSLCGIKRISEEEFHVSGVLEYPSDEEGGEGYN